MGLFCTIFILMVIALVLGLCLGLIKKGNVDLSLKADGFIPDYVPPNASG